MTDSDRQEFLQAVEASLDAIIDRKLARFNETYRDAQAWVTEASVESRVEIERAAVEARGEVERAAEVVAARQLLTGRAIATA